MLMRRMKEGHGQDVLLVANAIVEAVECGIVEGMLR